MNATVHDRIAAAREALVRAGLQPTHAATDASVLARHALGWDRATLLVRGREAPPPSFASSFDELVARRAAREPVALIMGTREFWGLDFAVTSDVLLPRPETEFIVEEALAEFEDPPGTVIDIGTGTGCLAIALACEFPEARVVATDISGAALAVARRNAASHAVGHRISFVRTSFLTGIRARADLIVSNPPYVPDSAAPALSPEVIGHEPHVALFGGADGLAPILYDPGNRRALPRARRQADRGIWFRSGTGRLGARRDVRMARAAAARRPAGDPPHHRARETIVTGCLFCRIVAGEVPATIVYQDDKLVAFKDINPQAPGHVLVIPRRHIASLNDLTATDDALVGEMIRRAAVLAGEMGFTERGYRTVFNTNADAGQTVFHIHLHVLGGRRMTWPPG